MAGRRGGGEPLLSGAAQGGAGPRLSSAGPCGQMDGRAAKARGQQPAAPGLARLRPPRGRGGQCWPQPSPGHGPVPSSHGRFPRPGSHPALPTEHSRDLARGGGGAEQGAAGRAGGCWQPFGSQSPPAHPSVSAPSFSLGLCRIPCTVPGPVHRARSLLYASSLHHAGYPHRGHPAGDMASRVQHSPRLPGAPSPCSPGETEAQAASAFGTGSSAAR